MTGVWSYEKVQSTREQKASVEEQTIVYGCSQKKVMLWVEIIILSILLDQIEIDGMTVKSFGSSLNSRIPKEITCR